MKLSNKTIQRLNNKYGNWILITGATSGIGKEIALKFGEAGFNLIITGRREKLLHELSSLLFDKYQVETIPIVGDLSNEDEVQHLIKETAHLNIGIAVLNAGFGTSGKFIDANLEVEINMLNLNCKALMMLTHHFANKMKKQPQRGAIVLMSSMVAFQGVPNAAHYAATKAYVQSFGEAIALELKSEGIDIICAAPGPVESGFSERANMKMSMALSPEDVGIPIINAIGKKTTVLPGFLTKLLVYNLRMTPRWGKIRIMGNVMSGFTKHQT
ncbi:MAG: SDR family NAD(P)-dependent oxidoreductase [Bacteroidota bacterium]